MKTESGYVHALVKKTTSVARELCFWPPHRWNLVQMAHAHAHADVHAQGVHHHFPFNSRQLMPVKTAVLAIQTFKLCITIPLLGITEG